MALGLAAGTVGVETVGSITCPAMRSNLVSIKTTAGLVAHDNIVVTKLRGSVGPITRTSPDDPASVQIPFQTVPDYTKSCKITGLANSRLGVPRNNGENPFAASMNLAPVMETFDRVLDVLRGLGVTVINNTNYTAYGEVNGNDAPPAACGPFRILTLKDLIACTTSLPEEEYPSRDIAYWDLASEGADFQSTKITQAVEKMKYLGGPGRIDGALDAAGADALIFLSVCSSDIPGLVGYPVICVPLGFLPEGTVEKRNPRGNLVEEAPGIPFGISFIGRPYSEQRLIELAYAFEQLTGIGLQRKPMLLPNADLCSTMKKRGYFSSILSWRTF
ncbi:amidase signature domain-containing protein [Lasiosphaeris hirsuta]|uniref:Amidase signature domain-containing protein n=1 Tax=Lasiosphaeris hirsuta TaxID=260670 RepID=A0AA39ZS76_9PEZI|nr:amidase signature domain-containing protein [Lasiosphaeris hirsuta]